MKKLLLLVAASSLFSFSIVHEPLTDQERKSAIDILTKTEQGVFDAVKGLSDAQLKFKPDAESWGVEECAKHIAMSEMALWQMIDGALKQGANPEKRSEIKATDEQVVQMVESRAQKVKTFSALEPQNTPFKSLDEALESFKASRAKLIEYVKSTPDELRNYVVTLPPGSFDCYQMVLFIGAHSARHTLQMKEVMENANFPKQ